MPKRPSPWTAFSAAAERAARTELAIADWPVHRYSDRDLVQVAAAHYHRRSNGDSAATDAGRIAADVVTQEATWEIASWSAEVTQVLNCSSFHGVVLLRRTDHWPIHLVQLQRAATVLVHDRAVAAAVAVKRGPQEVAVGTVVHMPIELIPQAPSCAALGIHQALDTSRLVVRPTGGDVEGVGVVVVAAAVVDGDGPFPSGATDRTHPYYRAAPADPIPYKVADMHSDRDCVHRSAGDALVLLPRLHLERHYNILAPPQRHLSFPEVHSEWTFPLDRLLPGYQQQLRLLRPWPSRPSSSSPLASPVAVQALPLPSAYYCSSTPTCPPGVFPPLRLLLSHSGPVLSSRSSSACTPPPSPAP